MLKEKNTDGHVNNKKMRKTELVPNKSVGEFVLGSDIRKYTHLPHYLTKNKEKDFSYESYNFYEKDLILWVEKSKIETICCEKECYWADHNLIKMPFDEFLLSYNVTPDKSENIYILVNGKGQNQTVYDFDKLGLQIWVWRKRIVTVLVSNYRNCE